MLPRPREWALRSSPLRQSACFLRELCRLRPEGYQALARRDEIGTHAKNEAFAASMRAIATPFLPELSTTLL